MANPIALGITGTAQRLGMDPIDLATIISFETGGTFNPTQPGPTTKWGQHRGFIQWGEPQAQQYGVNWDDPINSQLGPGGAVEKYFLDRGWKPGMSTMDAYSIVNAGGPGRYNAMDSGSSVADKVAGFGPHREKGAAFLGMSGGAGGAIGAPDLTFPASEQERQQQAQQWMQEHGQGPVRPLINTSGTGLRTFPSGLRPNMSVEPIATGAQDIETLSSLISQPQQTKAAKAQQIFDRIKEY